MPMVKPEDFGNEEYCCYCFKNGTFTDPTLTLPQMIEKLIPFAIQMGKSENDARKMASEQLPKLKRWNKK